MPETVPMTDAERAKEIAKAFGDDPKNQPEPEMVLPPPLSEQAATRRRNRVTTFVNPVQAVPGVGPATVVAHPVPKSPPPKVGISGEILGPVEFANRFFAGLAGGNLRLVADAGSTPDGIVSTFRRVYQSYVAATRDIESKGDVYFQWDS